MEILRPDFFWSLVALSRARQAELIREAEMARLAQTAQAARPAWWRPAHWISMAQRWRRPVVELSPPLAD